MPGHRWFRRQTLALGPKFRDWISSDFRREVDFDIRVYLVSQD